MDIHADIWIAETSFWLFVSGCYSVVGNRAGEPNFTMLLVQWFCQYKYDESGRSQRHLKCATHHYTCTEAFYIWPSVHPMLFNHLICPWNLMYGMLTTVSFHPSMPWSMIPWKIIWETEIGQEVQLRHHYKATPQTSLLNAKMEFGWLQARFCSFQCQLNPWLTVAPTYPPHQSTVTPWSGMV